MIINTTLKLNNTIKILKENKIMRLGITFSSFDLLHAGHAVMLKEAKKLLISQEKSTVLKKELKFTITQQSIVFQLQKLKLI